MPRTPLPEGTLLLGRYRVEHVLGQGGFGITYLARNEFLDVPVAVKEYFPIGFADRVGGIDVAPREAQHDSFKWGRTRFIEEARFLARLEHPHIAGVSELFEEKGTAYMVLRYETGDSLRRWASRLKRPPTQDELDRIVAPLLDALEFLHDRRVLHRDIAPDNIMVRADGSPVLIDFGAARRLVDARSQGMTSIVKSGYSPPESYVTTPNVAGPWTDIYALAASIYHLVAGVAPVEATKRTLADDLKPLTEVVHAASYRPQFLAAVDHGLAIRARDRPQTIAAWRRQLEPVVAAPRSRPGSGAAAEPGPAHIAVGEAVAMPTRMIEPAGGAGAAGAGAAAVRPPLASAARPLSTPAPSRPSRLPPAVEGADGDGEDGAVAALLANPLDWAVVLVSLAGLVGAAGILAGTWGLGRDPSASDQLWLRVALLAMVWPTMVSYFVYNAAYLATGGGAADNVRAAGRWIAKRNLSLVGQVTLLFVVTSPIVLVWLGLATLARWARAPIPIVLGLPLLAGLVAAGAAIIAKVPADVLGPTDLDGIVYWSFALLPVVAGGLGLVSSGVYAVRSARTAAAG